MTAHRPPGLFRSPRLCRIPCRLHGAADPGTLHPAIPAPEPAPETPEELAGPRYALGEQFSRGGMGGLWYARESATGRTIALKRILGRPDADSFRRFLNEARITARLEHPNIVPVHGLGTDPDGHPFYTMKLVQGTDLDAVLKKLAGGDEETIARFPLAQLLIIFQKVCDAVAFAHSRSVIHRDLKPANIMLGPFGEVLVMDWGLAKDLSQPKPNLTSDSPGKAIASLAPSPADDRVTVAEGEPVSEEDRATIARPEPSPEDNHVTAPGPEPSPAAGSETLPGRAYGSPHYMAPEQARGEIHLHDARTDIYALGAILYQIVSLRRAVSGRTASELIARVSEGDLDPLVPDGAGDKEAGLPPELRREKIPRVELRHLPGGVIPESLVPVVLRAMAFKPEGRYQSVPELQREITAYQNGFATGAERAGLGKQILLALRRNRREATVAGTALLLLLLLAVASFLRIRRERDLADQQRRRAVASRTAADELINFMQYDLTERLGKLGQLKVMEGINAVIQLYYQKHPTDPEERAATDKADRERSVSLSQQGDVLSAQGVLRGALKSHRESLAIAEKLVQKDPENADWQYDLSISGINVGDVLSAQGDLPGALKRYRESSAIFEKLAQKDPENAKWQHALSISTEAVGNVLKAQGNLPGALMSYREGLAIMEKLAQMDPDDTGWQRDLSVIGIKVGDVLSAQGDLPGALKSYRESLAIMEKLAQKDPDNAKWQHALSSSYIKVGDVLSAQGDLSGAIKKYRENLAIREELAQKDPDNADWQFALSISYERVGDVARRQQRWAEAAAAYAHEVEIARLWLAKDNADVAWLNSFAVGAGSCLELLRVAPAGAVTLDRAKALADLRTARDRLQKLKEQDRLVPPMDKNLPLFEKTIEAAEQTSNAPARSH